MTASSVDKDTKGIEAFRAWLVVMGGAILEPANRYEELRFRGGGEIGIVHRNDHNRPKKFNDHAHRLWQAFRDGQSPDLTPPKPQRFSATIFADASFCLRTHAAGWACWIKTSDRPGLVLGGPLQGSCAHPQQAEIFALARAVNEAHRLGVLGGAGETVSLQSDCVSALFAVLRHVPGAVESQHAEGAKISPRYLVDLGLLEFEALDIILACVCEAGVGLAVRHVRGHQAGGGRQWVNRQCDDVARRHMWARRDEMAAAAIPMPDRPQEAAHG